MRPESDVEFGVQSGYITVQNVLLFHHFTGKYFGLYGIDFVLLFHNYLWILNEILSKCVKLIQFSRKMTSA